MEPVAIRRITAEDGPRVIDALARSFHDDPVMEWLYPDEGRRVDQSRRFFEVRLRQLLPDGEVYTTPDLVGGALWAVPGKWRMRPLEVLRLLVAMAPALGRRGPRALRGLERVEARHPAEPEHYYLAVLGTEPESQGRGIGSALMGPVLEDCDENGVPAYLESSKERNIAFYARHGFKVTEEIRMPKGPLVWGMWRDPRP
jgi:ribosomal protein S18 acetylase RimI-like enzyme